MKGRIRRALLEKTGENCFSTRLKPSKDPVKLRSPDSSRPPLARPWVVLGANHSNASTLASTLASTTFARDRRYGFPSRVSPAFAPSHRSLVANSSSEISRSRTIGCAARARLAFARPLLTTSPRARDVARARTTRRCGREKRSPRPRTDSRARTTLAPRPGRLARLHATTTDDCGGRRGAAIDARVRLSDPACVYRLDCIYIPLETPTIRVQRPTRTHTRPPRPHPRPPSGCRPSIEPSLGAGRSFVGARVVVRVRAIRAGRPAFARASFVGRFVAMMRAARGGGGGGGHAPSLAGMVDARVHVITNDGRHVVGTLRGFDQVTNVILEGCSERVYSSERGVEEAPLGLYMIRGDNMCVLSTDSNAWGGGVARRSTRRRGG